MLNFGTAEIKKNCAKFCCEPAEPRLVALSFLTIVLGGTAALHAYRAWGAVIFCRQKFACFFFALARKDALARLPLEKKRSTLKVKHRCRTQ
jgi:hypothetical protein